MGERDRVNEWLEGRTDLPVRRREGAIEFALGVIAAADQRANSAARIIDRDERSLEIGHRRVFAFFRRPIIGLQRMPEIRLVFDLGSAASRAPGSRRSAPPDRASCK